MYSDDMLHKRHAIRSHPNVIEAVRAWWHYLPKLGESPEGLTPRDGSVTFGITKPVYCATVVAIQMVRSYREATHVLISHRR